MPSKLFEHLEGCTPLSQCAVCRSVAFLKSRLSGEEFQEFLCIATNTANPAQQIAPESSINNMDGMSRRTKNVLISIGVEKVEDLLKKTNQELRKCPNFGHVTMAEIVESLEFYGLKLATESTP